MRTYHVSIIFAALFLSACEDNTLAPCAQAYQDTCGNWIPGSEALCYDRGPGPSPMEESTFAPPMQGHTTVTVGCAGGRKDRFGAPDAVSDGEGGWDWWCCVDSRDAGPVVSTDGPSDAPADAAHVTSASN